MQVDDPPYLSVGTAVSAKYKGAFCEAKVSKVVRIVKCKVTYKIMGLAANTVNDDQIKGVLRVGHTVLVKHPDRMALVEGTITKIQDCSQYTVVFDDGDITTLRRSALCLKSGRHFNESETLDQLPLTHPEHFGNPVVGGRRGRRNRQDDSSEGEIEEENEPDLEGYSTDIGRVVSVESTDKKRGKDNWFPGLVVIPSAQPNGKINIKDEYLVRSFKDGRYYTVPKKEVSEFNREVGEKVESSVLGEAVGKAMKYLDDNELPVHWERNSLFNMQSLDTDSEDNFSDSSDEGPNEEKDRFVAQLYKFMDDAGTPLNKTPIIADKDVDLHRLFKIVHKLGGYNRVTNQNKWRTISTRLKLPNNQVTNNQVKSVYKKCLFSYESFYRTLGVTMLNHTRGTKKNRGRSLIRDKDRTTPVNSPKLEKEDEIIEKNDDEVSIPEEKPKKKVEVKKEEDAKRKFENSDTNSSDATDQSEPTPGPSKEIGRPKRLDKSKEKKPKTPIGIERVKSIDSIKKEEDEKLIQQTRSKSQIPKAKESPLVPQEKKKEPKQPEPPKTPLPKPVKKVEEEKKRGRKKLNPDEKNPPETPEPAPTNLINVGDKLKVFYKATSESKVTTYEAKVLNVEKDANGIAYLVHYTGWNNRYDEWISPSRIAENLSARAKRIKQGNAGMSTPKTSNTKPIAGKRGRGTSLSGRNTSSEAPRSTTPSSVTSSSSRTKSPATPATRSSSRMIRQESSRKTRRASAHTDVSMHTDSDSELSESESELTRTRSGTKAEEPELKTYKKRAAKTPSKIDKLKEDVDTEKEEEVTDRPKRNRKLKKSPEKSTEESDDDSSTNLPRGRDFDLNQIRSELKGFGKAVKTPLDSGDKEDSSSSIESSEPLSTKHEDVEEKKEVKPVEKSPCSDDIYEFKEPEPFEFESRSKLTDEKNAKKRTPRLYEELDSPKRRTIKSPGKADKDSPDTEKKLRRTPVRKTEDSDEDEKKEEDPFDKLVESPSFNFVKASEKIPENKSKVVRNLMKEPERTPLSLFRELPETSDDYSRDMELSDTESQTPIFRRDEELFSDTFSKSSPERNTLLDSITRAIDPSSDDGNNLSDEELLITPSTSSYGKKIDIIGAVNTLVGISETAKEEKVEISPKIEDKKDTSNSQVSSDLKMAIPAESTATTSSLSKQEDVKDIKPLLKITDSILQKFDSIKKTEKTVTKPDSEQQDIKRESESNIEDIKPELKVKPSESELKKSPIIKPELNMDLKKRRKILSKAYIEESDSDSSDSEQLIIARSDEDSRTNSTDKPEPINIRSPGILATTDDSESQERNFKFEKMEKSPSPLLVPEITEEVESAKEEEEPDSQLHSLLLCEETIPRSPAPVSEGSTIPEQKPKAKSVLEMPFASAPGSSNNKNMLMSVEHKIVNKPLQPPIIPKDTQEASPALVNSPPTTPESSISNLSPRGDAEDLSPNTIENESCKSNDAEPEYTRKRRNSSISKPPTYSEDDSQTLNEPGTAKKSRDETAPASCRKRRKSARMDEPPVKRGRKPLNRSRHNSDSDDTSEHSNAPTPGNSYDTRVATKSPRPSKYNFYVEFDPSVNSGQRIAVLQQKLSELRKTYTEVKTELAVIDRRRKKIRRREREALKASKQELVCG